MKFIILPHQLFSEKYLDKNYSYILWEHPHYFTKYDYNKKKLLLHRSSMQIYFTTMKKKNYRIKYLEFNQTIMKHDHYVMFDPIDRINFGINNLTIIESPNFLLSKHQYEMYRQKTKHFIFNNFYRWGKQELNIIPNIKSQDKYNRKSLPRNIIIPTTSTLSNTNEQLIIKKAKIYIEKHFIKNPGNIENFIYPISHKTTKKWLHRWVENKFKKFGDFQDAIDSRDSFLYHSVLSSSINIGLINPSDIIAIIREYKNTTPLNSYEGYVRQLFWREYQRYCYIYYNFDMKNYFNDNKKLTKAWYTGNTGIDPIDSCIIRGFDQAYLNHIERLMIIGNYMVLSGIDPSEGFKWFMEMSCDSYEWVMTQNVLDMVFFVSGGVTMRRPYFSSSNYIKKMGNYEKGKWCDIWDDLYKKFKKEKKEKLWKFRYFFPGLI